MPQGRGHLQLNGLLVVDKPPGWSSMDVVRRVRRAAAGAKTGHAGTLDPLATGVIVCCLGRATTAVERLMGLRKIYQAEIDLSAFTTTDDREGDRSEVETPQPDLLAVRKALAQFEGVIEQRPPDYSAIHVAGQRAYKRARRGEVLHLSPRKVHVDSVELLDYTWPVVAVRITCGRGTYIRSIARDLGTALGSGGHIAHLRRLAVGPYDLSKSIDAQRLTEPIGQTDLLDWQSPR